MKVSELEWAELDCWVAKASGLTPEMSNGGVGPCYLSTDHAAPFEPSINWSQGGPIIEREGIAIYPRGGGNNPWQAECIGFPENEDDSIWYGIGQTPLIAAMRAFVASRYGEEVPQ